MLSLQTYIREIIEKSHIINLFFDLTEMKSRIKDAYESLYKNCNEITEHVLVSVVIPTRNEAKRIPKLLHSLRKQCHKNIEVIVVDYKSTDPTPKIAEYMGAKVLQIDTPGVGYATYLGVKYSRGDVIIRTDADTIFPKDIIQRAIDLLRSKLVAHVGHIYYDAGFIENAMAFYYDKYLRKPWNTTGHFIAFTRDIVKRGINFNPKLRYDDDWEFGYRVYQEFGSSAFSYDYYSSIFTSARRIQATGLTKYILGYRKR